MSLRPSTAAPLLGPDAGPPGSRLAQVLAIGDNHRRAVETGVNKKKKPPVQKTIPVAVPVKELFLHTKNGPFRGRNAFGFPELMSTLAYGGEGGLKVGGSYLVANAPYNALGQIHEGALIPKPDGTDVMNKAFDYMNVECLMTLFTLTKKSTPDNPSSEYKAQVLCGAHSIAVMIKYNFSASILPISPFADTAIVKVSNTFSLTQLRDDMLARTPVYAQMKANRALFVPRMDPNLSFSKDYFIFQTV